MFESNDIYAIGLPVAFTFIAIEAAYSIWSKKDFYKRADSYGSLGLFAGNVLMVFLTKGLIFSLYLYIFKFNLFNISDFFPEWLVWVMAFVLIDFTFYWYHRASHRVRFLWAIHMNHHSSEEMNLLVAFRQAWFNPFAKIPFFIFLPLLVLDPTITVIAGAFSTLYGVIGHTQIIRKLGWLEHILVTPSHHRVHHGSNDIYLDKNYGNLLIIWDKIFGTFEVETEKVVYGIKNNVNTFNPVKITFRDWRLLVKDINRSESLSQRLKHIFYPPDWKP